MINNNKTKSKFRNYALDYLNTIALRMFELGLDEIMTDKLYLHANFHLKMFSIIVRGEIRCFKFDKNSVIKESEETPLFMLFEIVVNSPEINRILDNEEKEINRLLQMFNSEEQETSYNAGDRG